jgi:hypothetical protein
LPSEDAKKVEDNAKALGIEAGDVIANALRPITSYPHKEVAFVTVAVIEDDYLWLRAYAKAKGYEASDLSWLLDEAIGDGLARMREAAKH